MREGKPRVRTSQVERGCRRSQSDLAGRSPPGALAGCGGAGHAEPKPHLRAQRVGARTRRVRGRSPGPAARWRGSRRWRGRICERSESRHRRRWGRSPGRQAKRGNPAGRPAGVGRNGRGRQQGSLFLRAVANKKGGLASPAGTEQEPTARSAARAAGLPRFARRPQASTARSGEAATQCAQGRRPGAKARQGGRRPTQCAECRRHGGL